MATKKPVWVDEDAHAILKRYAKLTKSSMVDVASRLVLERLNDLSPDAGLTEPVEPAPAPVPAEPVSTKPAPVPRPIQQAKRKPRKPMPDPNDKNVRFVGGIWIV